MTITKEKILEALQHNHDSPMKMKYLSRVLGLQTSQRRHLREYLDRMVREGLLEKLRGGRFRLASSQGETRDVPGAEPPSSSRSKKGHTREASNRNRLTGRLITHRDGYGFVEVEGRDTTKSAGISPSKVSNEKAPGPQGRDRSVPNSSFIGSHVAPLRGDVFIPPFKMGGALNGDRVVVEIDAVKRDGRAEGHVIKTLERKFNSMVGQFKQRGSTAVVIPSDEKFLHQVLIERGDEGAAKEGDIVDVEITRFPTSLESPRGRVMEVLGRTGDFGLDVEIMIRKHHLPHRFPAEVQEAAEGVPQTISHEEIRRREDFRALPIVTIDGETAKDFDDAVHVRRLGNGNYELQVHIADVAHYVIPGSPLDSEARLRGTSVYFPDRAVPMLPEELSNGICSLKPNVDRLVQSCIMEINPRGDVVSHRFAQGVIRSAERMTYTSVAKILVDHDEATMTRYASLVKNFQLMEELALILNRMRDARGSIDFDLPEPIITFDENGMMTGVVRSERNIAHRLIEEFMLIANETVAREFFKGQVPSLYRIHEIPDPTRVAEFEMIARSFGYSLGIELVMKKLVVEKESRGRLKTRGSQRSEMKHATTTGFTAPHLWIQPSGLVVTPTHYQRLAAQIAGKPEERILSYLMLRSLKQARYSEQNLGHFGLASDCYTHFTSPIRRYPDLIVHRILKSLTARTKIDPHASHGRPKSSKPPASADHATTPGGVREPMAHGEVPYSNEQLHGIGNESSEAERRADGAERELIEWKKAKFMLERIGEELPGLITSVNKNGFYVELMDLFVEGFVSIGSLIDDYYVYRESMQCLLGDRTKKTFRIGDRLTVLVDRVDSDSHKIQFLVADLISKIPGPQRTRRRAHPDRRR